MPKFGRYLDCPPWLPVTSNLQISMELASLTEHFLALTQLFLRGMRSRNWRGWQYQRNPKVSSSLFGSRESPERRSGIFGGIDLTSKARKDAKYLKILLESDHSQTSLQTQLSGSKWRYDRLEIPDLDIFSLEQWGCSASKIDSKDPHQVFSATCELIEKHLNSRGLQSKLRSCARELVRLRAALVRP
jgi:hypothetical protein